MIEYNLFILSPINKLAYLILSNAEQTTAQYE